MIVTQTQNVVSGQMQEIDAQVAMIQRWLKLMIRPQRGALPPQAQEDLRVLRDGALRFITQWTQLKPTLKTLSDGEARRYHRHELKNTLNTVSGFAYLLLRDYSGRFEPEQFMAVQSVHSASKRLIELVSIL